MKLLTKKQVSDIKNNERRLAIDEGVKLAQKVDGLRELKLKEEAEIEKFRTESLKVAMEEISRHTKVRDALFAEVKTLEARRAEALMPIHREIEELDKKRAEVIALINQNESLKESNAQVSIELDKRNRDIVEKEREINRASVRVNEAVTSALEKLKEAETTLANARAFEAAKQREYKEKEIQLIAREEGITATMKRQEQRDKEQDSRERLLLATETRLNDRTQKLERNIKRFTK